MRFGSWKALELKILSLGMRCACRWAEVDDEPSDDPRIGLVSCDWADDLTTCLSTGSKNGNSVPDDAVREPELLWPRWADRLEATGEIGILRALSSRWQFAMR